MSYSWSQIQSYLKCPRKHELTYFENLEKIPSVENKSRLLGSTFHAGLAAALITSSEGNYDTTQLIAKAVEAAREYLKEQTIQNKVVKNYTTGERTLDSSYYSMIYEIHSTIPELLRYYIPQIGLGKKYRVAAFHDIWSDNIFFLNAFASGDTDLKAPLVEREFDIGEIKGIIDTLFIEIDTGKQVLVDWKLRGRLPFDELAAMDGQLALYAAVLNSMGASISETIMWQMRSTTPKPARLIKENTEPSIAAQDTTWDYWFATLPPNLQKRINADEWRNILDGKLKDETHFNRPITSEVTAFSSRVALENTTAAIKLIKAEEERYNNQQPASAVLSTYSCGYCEFWRLCSTVLKYGGDATELLEYEYRPRKGETDEDGLDL